MLNKGDNKTVVFKTAINIFLCWISSLRFRDKLKLIFWEVMALFLNKRRLLPIDHSPCRAACDTECLVYIDKVNYEREIKSTCSGTYLILGGENWTILSIT
jgi:hypothetical protein